MDRRAARRHGGMVISSRCGRLAGGQDSPHDAIRAFADGSLTLVVRSNFERLHVGRRVTGYVAILMRIDGS